MNNVNGITQTTTANTNYYSNTTVSNTIAEPTKAEVAATVEISAAGKQAAQAASSVSPASERITFTYQPHDYEPTTYTFTYEKYEGTYLRNIEDDALNGPGLRELYYGKLFSTDSKTANNVLDKGFFGTGIQTGGVDSYRTMDSVLARYEELREEVMKVFGHDSNLLQKNLASLDYALETKMGLLAHSMASQMEYERQVAYYGWNSDYPAFEGHKLGTNKDFDRDEFETNSKKMMLEFAKSYTAQIKGGSSYGNAREIALAMMSAMFNKTTSVNNLSFDDFMILEKYSMANVDVNSVKDVSDWLAKRDQINKEFNSNTEISDELRKLLDM